MCVHIYIERETERERENRTSLKLFLTQKKEYWTGFVEPEANKLGGLFKEKECNIISKNDE